MLKATSCGRNSLSSSLSYSTVRFAMASCKGTEVTLLGTVRIASVRHGNTRWKKGGIQVRYDVETSEWVLGVLDEQGQPSHVTWKLSGTVIIKVQLNKRILRIEFDGFERGSLALKAWQSDPVPLAELLKKISAGNPPPGVTELTSKAHESEELKLSKPPAANLQETRGILGGLVTQEEREMLTYQGTGRQMDNMKGKRKFEATDIGNVGLVTSSEENDGDSGRQMGAMKGKRKFFRIDTENDDATTSSKKSNTVSGRSMGAMKGKRKFFTIDTENVDPTTSGKKGVDLVSAHQTDLKKTDRKSETVEDGFLVTTASSKKNVSTQYPHSARRYFTAHTLAPDCYEARVSSLRTAVTGIEMTLQDMQGDIDRKQKHIIHLEHQNNNQQQLISELEGAKNLQQRSIELEDTINQNEQEIRKLVDSNDHLQHVIHELQDSNKQQQSTIDELQDSDQRQQQRFGQLVARLVQQHKRITDLEGKQKQQQKVVDDLQAKGNQKQKWVDELQKGNNQKQKRITELEDAVNCPICLSKRRGVVFQCGHSACGDCSVRVDRCPNCRNLITARITFFL